MYLDHEQQDELKLYFNNTVFDGFDPPLKLDEKEGHVVFVPVKKENGDWSNGLWVVKIIIQPGHLRDTLYTYKSEIFPVNCLVRFNDHNRKLGIELK